MHAPDTEGTDGCPTLSVEIRQHLGRLLACAYEEVSPPPSATERFADLLSKLAATLDEVSRRDTAEFQAGLLALAPALRRYARSLTHDPTAADDLVQDTLLRGWRGRGGFAPGTDLEAWIFTILRNVFYSRSRKSAREVQDEDGEQAARLTSPPEQTGHLDLTDVQAALARLAPQMREALVLVTIDDLSYEEAAALNCRIGTVKSRVWRARTQLARLLGYDGTEVGQDAFTLSAMDGSA